MREKINKLAKGNIDDVKPLIRVIPERLDFVTQKGELIKADVLLKSENHVPMKALAYSSDPRVKVLTPSFGGESAVLRLQFNYAVYDAVGSFSGEIDLVTNGGEFTLPYSVTIQQDKNEEFLHSLKSVDDFDKIVHADESGALRLFQYKNFTDAAFMQDPTVYMLYGAFLNRPDKTSAMHRFIQAVRTYTGRDDAMDAGRVQVEEGPERGAEAAAGTETAQAREHAHGRKYFFARYFRTRLSYELGDRKDEELLAQLKGDLDALSAYEQDEPYITLFKAEYELLRGDAQNAMSVISAVRSKIQNNRQQYLDEYFLLEFLNCEINGDNSRRASYIRLLHKFITEEKKYRLFMYLVRTDDALRSDDAALYELMHRLYDEGYRSPVLYLEYVRFLNAHPDYLHDPTNLDMHALFFGCRNDMLGAQLISELANRASLLNLNNILYYPIFASLYKKTNSKALLQAVCSTLIRGDRRDAACHHWYAQGVACDARINGLYEYYLYSLSPYDESIDEAVLVHFSRGDNLDAMTRARLYAYVVKNKDNNALLYRVYEPKIQAFTLAALKERHISDDLVVLYQRLLSEDIDPQDYYDCLPEILSTYRFRTEDKDIRAVVALYPQLRHEQVFSVDADGCAFVPVISDDMIVLVQDSYGNRYCDRTVTKEKLFDKKELLDICKLRCPQDTTVQLLTIDELSRKDCTTYEQARALENAAASLPLSGPYKLRIHRRLIDFYDSEYSTGFKSGYMQDIQKAELDRAYRGRLTGARIRAGYYQEAFADICTDGYDEVQSDRLRLLCDKLIADEPVKQREQLLLAAYEAMHRDSTDKLILDYLCEYFNASSQAMYDVLEKAISEGIDTSDLEERLLAQLIFTDDTKMIDRVFSWYVERKRASEQLIKAYFTIRTYRYFLYDEPTDASVFEYIESVAAASSGPTALPIVHQLALTKFYSGLEECSDEQIKLADTLIHSLFLKGYSFPYFKKFRRYFELPSELNDDVMALYRARGTGKPYVMTKLESVDADFKPDTLKRMYKSLYVLDKILFAGEKLDYEIYEVEDGIDTLKAQGILEAESDAQDKGTSRFSRLNEMIRNFNSTDEMTLRRNMEAYLVGSEVASKLFNKK